MTDHLLDHVRPHIDHSTEERIAYIQTPRWTDRRDRGDCLRGGRGRGEVP